MRLVASGFIASLSWLVVTQACAPDHIYVQPIWPIFNSGSQEPKGDLSLTTAPAGQENCRRGATKAKKQRST